MEGFLICIGALLWILLLVAGIVGICKWACSDPCEHSYERIDTPNDKKMILVCRRCGKIKKLRK